MVNHSTAKVIMRDAVDLRSMSEGRMLGGAGDGMQGRSDVSERFVGDYAVVVRSTALPLGSVVPPGDSRASVTGKVRGEGKLGEGVSSSCTSKALGESCSSGQDHCSGWIPHFILRHK